MLAAVFGLPLQKGGLAPRGAPYVSICSLIEICFIGIYCLLCNLQYLPWFSLIIFCSMDTSHCFRKKACGSGAQGI